MKLATLTLAAYAVACTPDFADQPYLVDRPRLIAVIADPAEARPRDVVTLTPVLIGPGAQQLQPTFHLCAEAPAAAEPRPVADSCLTRPGAALEARGSKARGAIPDDACATFGPDPTNSMLRPTDPDATGGFYQPFFVDGLSEPSVARVRIHCALPDVATDVAQQLEQQYVLNRNPQLLSLEVLESGVSSVDHSLTTGASNRLRVTWSQTSAESYAWLPIDGDAVEQRVESLRISWFTSGGELGSSATAPTPTGDGSENTLLLAAGESHVDLWVVLQDSRGGSDAKHWRLRATP